MVLSRFGQQTHVGTVRAHNEDSYLVDANLGLGVVADGMGGHEAGEVASKIVVDEIHTSVKNGADIATAVSQANVALFRAIAAGQGSPGMGSTVVAAKINGTDFEVAWVGDSRAYLWDDGRLSPLTRDHSVIQELLEAGLIGLDEVAGHPHRHYVTQAIGKVVPEELKVGHVHVPLGDGQKVLLCSDGLTGEVDVAELARVIGQAADDQSAVEGMVQEALARGGNDNITVLLLSVPSVVAKKI